MCGTDRSFRTDNIARLRRLRAADVVVLGGGVNGVAVLRDLALNGVRAVLLDQRDFCAGASSASTRMAHGGLRYLENREFRLVAESTRERNLLLKNAPHQTVPLQVVVPLESYAGGLTGSVLNFLGVLRRRARLSAFALALALMLYEFLGRVNRVLPRPAIALSRSKLPDWLASRYKAMACYFDARIRNPEALILEMLEEALSSQVDAVALNYADWSNEAGGEFSITDSVTGESFSLRTKVVVNATGAWADRVNARLGLKTDYVTAVKGAHIVLRDDALRERLEGRAFYFDDGSGRMVICCPLERTVLMGTTEIPVEDPAKVQVEKQEVDYLKMALARLVPDIAITDNQIVAATSGCRPLRKSGDREVNRANRDHAVHTVFVRDQDFHVISLAGGKWTTFRALAEEVSDQVLAHLGRTRVVSTRNRRYPGAASMEDPGRSHEALARDCASATGLPLKRVALLVRRYGAIGARVAAFCSQGEDRALEALPLYSEREIVWLIRSRGALLLDDIVLRRTQIALDGLASVEALREIAALLARTLDRPKDWADGEVARCLQIKAICLRPPLSADTPSSNDSGPDGGTRSASFA